MGTREALVGYACVPKGSCNLRRTDSLYSCRWSTSVRGHSEIYQYMSWVRFKYSFFQWHSQLCCNANCICCLLCFTNLDSNIQANSLHMNIQLFHYTYSAEIDRAIYVIAGLQYRKDMAWLKLVLVGHFQSMMKHLLAVLVPLCLVHTLRYRTKVVSIFTSADIYLPKKKALFSLLMVQLIPDLVNYLMT